MTRLKIHMVGVGGISMRGLASYFQEQGHTVTGCDVANVKVAGLSVRHGHNSSHITADVNQVIINAAITPSSTGWSEVLTAEKLGIPVIKRAAAIGEITRERPTVAGSGTNGKSTTTGMIATIMLAAGRDPFVMVGAEVPAFHRRTYHAGSGPFILEADEFDRSFHQFASDLAVVTNIDRDHLDYYTGDLPEIISAFAGFFRLIKPGGKLVAPRHDVAVAQAIGESGLTTSQILTFGRDGEADYQIIDQGTEKQVNQFRLRRSAGEIVVDLHVPGLFNQLNATAAIIVADLADIPIATTKLALAKYRGLGRRFEILLDTPATTIITDYGHHPVEIEQTLRAARTYYPGRRLVVVFQAHQYARTNFFSKDFIRVLAEADLAVMTDIFAVTGREEDHYIEAPALAAAITSINGEQARYLAVPELVAGLADVVRPQDIVLFMGAGGDIDHLAHQFAKVM